MSTWLGQPPFSRDVVDEVAQPAKHARAPGLERAHERGGVRREEVGGGGGVGQELRRERSLRRRRAVELRGVDKLLEQPLGEEVRLEQRVEERVVGPRRRPEARVLGIGRGGVGKPSADEAGAQPCPDEAHRRAVADPRRRRGPRAHGGPLQRPHERAAECHGIRRVEPALDGAERVVERTGECFVGGHSRRHARDATVRRPGTADCPPEIHCAKTCAQR